MLFIDTMVLALLIKRPHDTMFYSNSHNLLMNNTNSLVNISSDLLFLRYEFALNDRRVPSRVKVLKIDLVIYVHYNNILGDFRILLIIV